MITKVQHISVSERVTYSRWLLSILCLFLLVMTAAAQEPGSSQGEAHYASLDGKRIYYKSYGKGREALVLVHCWTCNMDHWRDQIPDFAKRNRVIALDLPGHGQSDKPEVSYTMDLFARAIDAVMRDAGVERGVLVGHSMGTPVAITFLRLFPARTKALVMVDGFVPQAPKDDADRASQKARMDPFLRSFREPNYKETAQKMIQGMFSDKTTPAQREEIQSKMGATPQHVMASAMEGMFALEAPKPGETYSVPVMAIMVASPGRAGYETQLRAVFPNLRKYEAWEGSGHFLMMESPARFNSALEEFLAGLERRP